MNRRASEDGNFVADMANRAAELAPLLRLEQRQDVPLAPDPSGLTIMQHVTRLCTEWAEADPAKTEKRQQTYGTWAQVWAVNARGVFSINLNTGSVWQMRARPRTKPIGNVTDMTGEMLVALLRGD